jgi:hypothetical protein
MSVNINADTTNGLVLTSDTSGEIKLQSAGADIATVGSSGITMASGKGLAGDASSLTNIPAANLTGSLPAIDGSALTGISTNPYTAQALNSNGYIKFVGGMILQWGAVAVNSDSTTSISFPTSFPTACRQVVAVSATSANSQYLNGGAVTGFSTTAFTLFIYGPASTWRWFAVGY